MEEVNKLLQEVLERLDRIEQHICRPKVANINRNSPKFKIVTQDD
jgi:hypothetical protein